MTKDYSLFRIPSKSPFLELRFNQITMHFIYLEFRGQILQCKVLLKLIEFDFPLCKELKIDWKLPKNQFSIFSEKLKIELKIAQNQFSFVWNY